MHFCCYTFKMALKEAVHESKLAYCHVLQMFGWCEHCYSNEYTLQDAQFNISQSAVISSTAETKTFAAKIGVGVAIWSVFI